MNSRIVLAGVSAALIVGAGVASAAPLTVTSYDMFNGATGSYDYRDFTYLPCPANACDTTSAPLSGGLGKLTDGVSPTGSWYTYGLATPWVGWEYGVQDNTNPTVTFNFGSAKNVDSVTVWLDNTIGYGGVGLPTAVVIDGVAHTIAPDSVNPDPRPYTFTGLGLTGSSATVQFLQNIDNGTPWVMVGEVSFDGSPTGVPEPTAWGLILLGVGVMGGALRSRRRTAAGAA